MRKKELTRDSELYNRLMRNRVVNNSEFESEFTGDINLNYHITYERDLSWRSLDEKKNFTDISISRLDDLRSMDEIRLARECGRSTAGHVWRATGEMKFEVVVEYTVKLPDLDSILLSTSLDVNSRRDKGKVEDLISSILNKEAVSITLKDGYIIVNTGRYMFKGDLVEEFNDYEKEKIDPLINYLTSEGLYVSSTIGNPRYKDNRVYIPVIIGDSRVEFKFDEPESNQDFWRIADLYGEGDPLLISDSEVFMCLDHLDNSSDSLMRDGLFSVHTEQKNTLTKDILSTLNLGKIKSKTNSLLNSIY